MDIKTNSEIWVQAFYGQTWEDFHQSDSQDEAQTYMLFLKCCSPERKLRIIERTIDEKIVCDYGF